MSVTDFRKMNDNTNNPDWPIAVECTDGATVWINLFDERQAPLDAPVLDWLIEALTEARKVISS